MVARTVAPNRVWLAVWLAVGLAAAVWVFGWL